jgi:hypothetical protein
MMLSFEQSELGMSTDEFERLHSSSRRGHSPMSVR